MNFSLIALRVPEKKGDKGAVFFPFEVRKPTITLFILIMFELNILFFWKLFLSNLVPKSGLKSIFLPTVLQTFCVAYSTR